MNYKVSEHINKEAVFLVNWSDLDERFDPEFYNPSYLEIIKSRKEWDKISNIYTELSHPPEFERIYSDDGIQLIRSQNVRPNGINYDESPVYFSEEFLKKKKVVFPQRGDILIVRSGVNAGDLAVVEKATKNALIGADTLLLRVNNSYLPKFIQVFFATGSGKKLINRYVTGATNKHVSPHSLKKLLIPKVSKQVQRECISIFEKSLKQKKQKEAESEELLRSIDDYLLSELGIKIPVKDNSIENRIFTSTFKKFTGRRLDPGYHSYSFSLESPNFNNVPFLKHIAIDPYWTNDLEKNDEVSFVPMESINDKFGTIESNKKRSVKEAKGYTKFEEGDILWAKITPCMENGKSAIASNLENGAGFGSTEFFVLRCNSEINSNYLLALLRLNSLRENAINYFGGASGHQRVSSEFFKDLKIPLPKIDKQIEIGNNVEAMKSEAMNLEEEAYKEIEKARIKIEEIILQN